MAENVGKDMTAPTLADVCSAIWGPEWVQQAARELDINERNLRRMGAGDMPVPPGVWLELGGFLRREATRLDELVHACVRESQKPTHGVGYGGKR